MHLVTCAQRTRYKYRCVRARARVCGVSERVCVCRVCVAVSCVCECGVCACVCRV